MWKNRCRFFALIVAAILVIAVPTPALAEGGVRTEVYGEPITDENGVVIGERTTTVTFDEDGSELSREVETVLTSSESDEKGRPLSIKAVTD
ncbi:MAG: hypothetical protein IJS72_03740 [Oscillospiraceae bacterium]|nr:hypothetical protein [Oscillospiraceae bacterium]